MTAQKQTAEEWLENQIMDTDFIEDNPEELGDVISFDDAKKALAMARAEERESIDVIEWSYEKGKDEAANAIRLIFEKKGPWKYLNEKKEKTVISFTSDEWNVFWARWVLK